MVFESDFWFYGDFPLIAWMGAVAVFIPLGIYAHLYPNQPEPDWGTFKNPNISVENINRYPDRFLEKKD